MSTGNTEPVVEPVQPKILVTHEADIGGERIGIEMPQELIEDGFQTTVPRTNAYFDARATTLRIFDGVEDVDRHAFQPISTADPQKALQQYGRQSVDPLPVETAALTAQEGHPEETLKRFTSGNFPPTVDTALLENQLQSFVQGRLTPNQNDRGLFAGLFSLFGRRDFTFERDGEALVCVIPVVRDNAMIRIDLTPDRSLRIRTAKSNSGKEGWTFDITLERRESETYLNTLFKLNPQLLQ